MKHVEVLVYILTLVPLKDALVFVFVLVGCNIINMRVLNTASLRRRLNRFQQRLLGRLEFSENARLVEFWVHPLTVLRAIVVLDAVLQWTGHVEKHFCRILVLNL